MLEWLLDPWEAPFMQRAFAAMLLSGVSCAVVGVFIVLRRLAFLGGALAHTIFPGLVVAYLSAFPMMIGALGAALLTTLGVGALSGSGRVREDSAVGIMLAGMFALGVVLMAQANAFGDLNQLLFGSILGVTEADLAMAASTLVLVLLAMGLTFKEMELATCDEEYARQAGVSPRALRYVILSLAAFAVVSAVQLVGALLATAVLIVPAATGLLLARTLWGAIVAAIACSVGGGLAGLYASYYAPIPIPSGAAVVLALVLIFALTWIWVEWRHRN